MDNADAKVEKKNAFLSASSVSYRKDFSQQLEIILD